MANAGTIVVNLIARVDKFEKDMKKSMRSIESFKNSAQSAKVALSGLRVAAALYFTKTLSDGITAMHEAYRKSENVTQAFVDQIPVINQLSSSFNKLFLEVGGVAQKMEGLEKFGKAFATFSQFENQQGRALRLLGAGESGEGKLQALFKYQDALKKIADMEKELREAKKINPDIVLPNFGVDKAQALRMYRLEVEKIEQAQRKLREGPAQSALANLADQWGALYDEVVGKQDRWSIMLTQLDKQANFTVSQFKQAKKYIDEMREFEKIKLGEAIKLPEMEKTKTRFDEIGTAEIFQSANLNLSGLSQDGINALIGIQKEILSITRKAFA